MKTIGIIGGMSWESTALYYQGINRGVSESLGGLHSATLILYSVDFAEIEKLQHAGDWEAAGAILNRAAISLQAAGADFLLIATNTMHKVANRVVDALDIPLLHIVDPTANALLQAGHQRVGLLGTGFTMSDTFYKGRMQEVFGLEVIVPDESEQAQVHRIIYDELCLGIIRQPSREVYLQVIDRLIARGAEAVILGCTEITLLIQPSHTSAPLFDTTALHAAAAVTRALEGD